MCFFSSEIPEGSEDAQVAILGSDLQKPSGGFELDASQHLRARMLGEHDWRWYEAEALKLMWIPTFNTVESPEAARKIQTTLGAGLGALA
jgi:hypothetical protein